MSQSVPPQPGVFPPAPPMPARARGGSLALGVVTAVVVALVTAGVYGAIVGAIEKQIGFVAVGVGFLIGYAAGRAGGSHPVLPLLSALLSVGSVWLGQLIGTTINASDLLGVSATRFFFDHFGILMEAWQRSANPITFLFLALGAFAAYSGTKKAAAA
ncbi:hypothetical protein ACIQ6Y_30100 [Streptomyces sp. NPDC096205]|uniref:hypothetical protein n=1 Tax=Streptomyces sp. NPDC096205 TaxID=3366081 RepID=UPI003803CFBD